MRNFILLLVVSVSCIKDEPIFEKVYAYLKDGIIQITDDIFQDKPGLISPNMTIEDYAGYGTGDVWQENPICESRPLDLTILVDGSSSLR